MTAPSQFYSVVYADEKPTLLSVGVMREKLAAMGISLDAPLAKHALSGGALFAPDGHFRLATAENAALVAKPMHAVQALGEDGEPIPDVISADEMRAALVAGGIHLESNCAKSVLRRGDTLILSNERHVRIEVAEGGAPPTAGKAPAALTLLDRAAAVWCGDARAPEPEAVTSTSAPTARSLADQVADLYCASGVGAPAAVPAAPASQPAAVAQSDDDPYRAAADVYCGS